LNSDSFVRIFGLNYLFNISNWFWYLF